MTYNKKIAVWSWSLFDFASSPFSTIVITFIFATYFTQKIAVNEIIGTAQWGQTVSIASLFIAVLSPIFGAIADFSGHAKRWLAIFTVITILSTALLWWAKPEHSAVPMTLCLMGLGLVTFELSMVFYNALLLEIAPTTHIGRISGWAWALGYVGGLLALIIALFVFINGKPHFLSTERAEQIRICGPFAALWFAIFSLPLFLKVPVASTHPQALFKSISLGLHHLKNLVCKLPKEKKLLTYLIAHMIYIDGLNTLFAFGGIYAAYTFHMTLVQVTLFGIFINVTAGIGAFSFAWVDDFLGSKPTILISLLCLILITTLLLFVHSQWCFWVFGLALGIFVGPIQAASRSLMAHLTPKADALEMFGLYAFSGKLTAFLNPWLLSLFTVYFQSQRAGMATILIFFIIGGGLLQRV